MQPPRAMRIVPQDLPDAAPTDEEAATFLEDGAFLRRGGPDELAGSCSYWSKACLAILGPVVVFMVLDGARAAGPGRSERTVELEGEGACHTAVDGEECYTLVSWTMKVAEEGKNDWGGLGVTSSSTREDVQQALHQSEEGSVCPPPCALDRGIDGAETASDTAAAVVEAELSTSTTTTATTTTADAEYMQDMARAAALALAAPAKDLHAAAAEADLEGGGRPPSRPEAAGGEASTATTATVDANYAKARARATALALAAPAPDPHAAAAEAGVGSGSASDGAPAGPGGRLRAPAAVSASGCGVVQDMVYLPGNDLHTVPNVSKPEDCCEACSRVAACVAWTWGRRSSESESVLPHGAHMCYLKGSKPRVVLTRVFDPDFTSGWTTPAVKPGSITTQWPMDRGSLLCASSLASSSVGEEAARRLVALQHSLRTSIFNCDEYMVFASDDEKPVAPGVWPVLLPLAKPERWMGGSWARSGGKETEDRMFAVHVRLLHWRLLIQSNRYRFHDWTVKADPQTVFIPGRFRMRIRDLSYHLDEPPTGTSLAACEDHPSHAFEVLSQKAVEAWSLGWERCLDFFAPNVSINQSTEEGLVDQCLAMLQAKRDTDAHLLNSPECMQTVNCSNVSFAAYHPLRTEEAYRRCLEQSSPSTR